MFRLTDFTFVSLGYDCGREHIFFKNLFWQKKQKQFPSTKYIPKIS